MKSKKILFIVNHLAFFVSHRMSIAEELIKRNNKVKIISGNSASILMEKIAIREMKKKKIDYEKLSYSSSKINFFRDIIGIIKLVFIIKKFKPDIIHFVSAKGFLIGSVSSYFSNVKHKLVSVSGVGNFFIEKKITSKVIKFFYTKFILFFKNEDNKFIVQNNRDQNLIIKHFKLQKKNVFLFKGSGVDMTKINPSKKKQRKKIVLFPGRAVLEKGLLEFITASNHLKKKFPNWKFIIAGTLDYKGPGQINKMELNSLRNNKNLIFAGYQKNLNKLLKISSIVCLPSYNEGLSKSLIEAIFMKIPIITTNVPGCKELVKNHKTGFLVPPKNTSLLIKKLEKLMQDKKIRADMINNYKLFNPKIYDKKTIIVKHLKLYNSFFKNDQI